MGRKINSGGWVHGKEENKQKHPLLILILICAMLLFAMYLSRIRYLGFFPYVNKPATLCEFDEMGEVAIIYHIFAPIGYLLLLLLVIHTARRGKKKKKWRGNPPHNLEVLNLTTYTTPGFFVNQNGITFSKCVLEDLNYLQTVQYSKLQ